MYSNISILSTLLILNDITLDIGKVTQDENLFLVFSMNTFCFGTNSSIGPYSIDPSSVDPFSVDLSSVDPSVIKHTSNRDGSLRADESFFFVLFFSSDINPFPTSKYRKKRFPILSLMAFQQDKG